MEDHRRIEFYKSYFIEFYLELPPKVQEKFDFVFRIVKTVQIIPQKYFQHITGTDGIYEIRVEFEGNIYRVFSCFDKGNLVILFHGFQKKTQKTPAKEIEKAQKLKEAYFKNK